ncbi:MAG: AbrB/MazE/SpoVT family DNA-binding domain-containing protein [Desulfovibrio sp.]|nr:AbrB/MazE/SpoVT family DNA-binding domain-containing protein [Desulfovibrio sp.]
MNENNAALSLSRWGNSMAVRLPKKIIESLGWHEGDKLECVQKDGTISIKKTHNVKIRPLNEVLDSFHTAQEVPEIDWGKPVGREVW